MAESVKVKCVVSFFVNDKNGKQTLAGKRGQIIEVTPAAAKALAKNKQAFALAEAEPEEPANLEE